MPYEFGDIVLAPFPSRGWQIPKDLQGCDRYSPALAF